jgi:putative Ca2+/H+ antiporter (TMEM165/GDT1 family)
MTDARNDASVPSAMSASAFLSAFEPQQISSVVYFVAAALLIFVAAVLAGKKVQQQLPPKWLAVIAGLTLLTLALIWLLVVALNGREPGAQSPPVNYSAPTGTP